MGEGAPSHLRAALRLLARGVRERGRGTAVSGVVPRRRAAVERAAIPIEAGRVERYRRVTGGAPAADGEAIPPVYSSTWETALALELFAAADLPLPSRGLVHLASELVVLRALRVGDRVRCRLELERAEPHPAGTRVALGCRSWNAAGQLCQQNSLTFLIRQPAAGRARERSPEREPAGMGSAVEWRTLAEWSLPASLGRRYARASGDFNPIHLWAWSSRLLGFDRPIAHGFCTEAMLASTLAERLWRSDPAALRRLYIRFRSPLPLPARVLLQVGGELDEGHGRFQVVGRTPGGATFAEGEFVGG
jgi:acyl dehydratase